MFSGLAHINTASSRSFSHVVTFALDLAVFTNIVQFAYHKTTKSRGNMTGCRKWGPVYCLIAATILVDMDLVRHLINDAWGTICTETEDGQSIQICDKSGCKPLSDSYDKYCYSQPMMDEFSGGEGFHHLTFWGWTFTFIATWTGYLLLFIGIFWIINMPQKLRAQWRALRRARGAGTGREHLVSN